MTKKGQSQETDYDVLFNSTWLLFVPAPGSSHRLSEHLHTRGTCTVTGDLHIQHWASSPPLTWLVLVLSIPLCLSPPCLSVGLLSLGEVAMQWERQRLHLPTPPESWCPTSLAILGRSFSPPPSPSVTTEQQ